MKLADWIEGNDGAPVSEDDLAHNIVNAGIEDSDIGMIAKDFLEARSELMNALEEAGFEWG